MSVDGALMRSPLSRCGVTCPMNIVMRVPQDTSTPGRFDSRVTDRATVGFWDIARARAGVVSLVLLLVLGSVLVGARPVMAAPGDAVADVHLPEGYLDWTSPSVAFDGH